MADRMMAYTLDMWECTNDLGAYAAFVVEGKAMYGELWYDRFDDAADYAAGWCCMSGGDTYVWGVERHGARVLVAKYKLVEIEMRDESPSGIGGVS